MLASDSYTFNATRVMAYTQHESAQHLNTIGAFVPFVSTFSLAIFALASVPFMSTDNLAAFFEQRPRS